MNANKLYYQTLRDSILYQDNQHKQLSNNAVSLVGFAIALVAAGVVVLNLADDTIPDSNGFLAALGIWAGTFIATTGFCAHVLMPQNWKVGISINTLNELTMDLEAGEGYLRWNVIKGLEDAIKHNQRILDRKTESLRTAIIFLALEALGLITVGSSVIWWKIYPPATATLL